MSKMLEITLVKSLAKRLPKHKATAHGLGLKRMNQTVRLQDTKEIRGMVQHINYLVNVREV